MSGIAAETQGLLFDMDGVLISSIGSVERCWARWADHYRVDRERALTITHGRRAIDTVRTLRPDIDPVEGLRVIEDMEVLDMGDLVVLPGVAQLLSALPADRWTIVTSATTRLMTARLSHAGLPLPERMITGDMVVNGKPHPEPYIRGAEILGFAPQDCIVVEDAPAGVGAGKAAGSRVLAVMGSYPIAELHAADWVISSLEQMGFEETSSGLKLMFAPLR
ncbi:MAG: HAD-IA family hydrolase [Acidobacteriaceae bacterium]